MKIIWDLALELKLRNKMPGLSHNPLKSVAAFMTDNLYEPALFMWPSEDKETKLGARTLKPAKKDIVS